MTKAEFISYIKNLLPKVDKTAKYHDNVIAVAIDTACEQVFSDMYAKNPNSLDSYIKVYNDQEVKFDATTKRFYVSLPVSVYNLPKKSGGVVMVKEQGVNSTTNTSKYVAATEHEMVFMGSEIGYVSSLKFFSVHPDKIWLRSEFTEKNLNFLSTSGLTSFTSTNYTTHGIEGVGTIIDGTEALASYEITTSGASTFSVSNHERVVVYIVKTVKHTAGTDLTVRLSTALQYTEDSVDISSGEAVYYPDDIEYNSTQSRNAYITIYGTNADFPVNDIVSYVVSVYTVPKITLYLIPRFYDLANTDEFNVPFGQDERIIEMIIQNLGLIPPRDLINNNADQYGRN